MLRDIAKILRNTGHPECIQRADSWNATDYRLSMLNLRELQLTSEDIIAIANILQKGKLVNDDTLNSISISYNKLVGDACIGALLRSLPESISEIGLVNCDLGDEAGIAILEWMKSSPNLRMICMEQNNFSLHLKMEFAGFSKKNSGVTVVF